MGHEHDEFAHIQKLRRDGLGIGLFLTIPVGWLLAYGAGEL